MTFDQEIHTPVALAEEITEIYRKSPDTLLLGSLGRAVIFGNLLSNPQAEFQARSEVPERKFEYGEALARDIDVIGGLSKNLSILKPFEVDHVAFGSKLVRFVNEGSDWFLVSDTNNVYEQLHSAVMEPIEGESVYGAVATTVPLQTHQALFGLKGAMRPKDKANFDYLSSVKQPSSDKLADELYVPFDKLRLLANSGWLHNTRRVYRAVTPWYVRRKAAPFADRIKERLT